MEPRIRNSKTAMMPIVSEIFIICSINPPKATPGASAVAPGKFLVAAVLAKSRVMAVNLLTKKLVFRLVCSIDVDLQT